MNASRLSRITLALALFLGAAQAHADLDISDYPLFAGVAVPPKVMLSMSVDHQLFFEAYNEYTDLTGDGVPDTTYNHEVDYYGYFDSYKCYNYTSGEFRPASTTSSKYCSGNWSGNFLNWLTMARIDAVRKLLYGGYRSVDTDSRTVLERTHLPNDAHSWARYYNGEDISQLTPFSNQDNPAPLTVTHGVTATNWNNWRDSLPGTTGNNVNYQVRTITYSGSFPGFPGDAIFLEEPGTDRVMQGYIKDRPQDNQVRLVVVYAEGATGNPSNEWVMSNRSRSGVSFCNTTQGGTERSQDTDAAPLLRVARGNYTMWSANERWQCKWSEERSNTLAGGWGYNNEMAPNSNANIAAITGIMAATENPNRSSVGLGDTNYNVRVEVCNDGSDGALLEEKCQRYGSTYKPVGLLQTFSDRDRMLFGMVSGSYENNRSGGVLRKPAGTMGNEINPEDGTFTGADGIIKSMNALRVFGYRHNDGTYHNNNHGGGDATTDRCMWGTRSFDDGHCSNWGNPQSEIFLETLRYLSGQETPRFDADDSGRLTGLTTAEWDDPVSEELWCSPLSVVQFNASTSSFDAESLGYASDFGLDNLDSWTNQVGDGEGISGGSYFVGQAGAATDEVCTAKTVGSLSEVRGICPEAPRLQGSYHIAGLAYYAWLNDMRPDRQGTQNIMTQGVELAPAVPRISVIDSDGSEVAAVLPACREYRSGASPNLGSCAIVDFKVVHQEVTSTGSRGQFFVQWEDTEHGGDYDMDMTGILRYELSGSQLEVSTRVFGDSSDGQMAFGYVMSGTSDDGFHAHSGIGGFNHESHCSQSSIDCRLLAAETSRSYTLGGSAAEMLWPPLYYAAKWGGFDKSMGNAPTDPESWDSEGDGLPDNYAFATDPRRLEESLENALRQILALSETTSLATSSTRLETDTFFFQASFDTDDWSGDVTAVDPFTNDVEWRASEELPTPNNRNILVWDRDAESSLDFSTTGIPNDHYIRERLAPTGVAGTDPLVDLLIDYLRGDNSEEHQEGGTLRDRSTPLGDIINSEITFSGQGNEGWARLPETQGGGVTTNGSYGHFLDNIKSDRNDTIFVGSNNGMLHAFDARERSDGGGRELFAFVPAAVLERLHHLADPDYTHRFYVDGQISIADAYLNGAWRTVLVGTLGAGGKGVFALDVTDPANPSVLWDLTSEDEEELGYTYGRPQITRLENGDWVAVIGNGYNSTGNVPRLMVLDLEDGEVLHNIEATGGAEADTNGLSGPAIMLHPASRTHVWRAYAGDLAGNIWRFDFNSSVPQLTTAFSGPLFRTEEPITASPNLAVHPGGGVMVYVGTGKLIEDVDVSDTTLQTFYALRDQNNALTSANLNLLALSIGPEGFRTIEEVDSGNEGGWRMPLTVEGSHNGERVLHRARVQFGRVLFNTYEPVEDPCVPGGTQRLYLLDAISGLGGLNPPGVDCPGCGSIEIGGGAPSSPPTVIIPPGQTPPGTDPGGPGGPGDPDDPIIPGTGDSDGWCSLLGVPGPTEFYVLGTICDGRQVWRQAK